MSSKLTKKPKGPALVRAAGPILVAGSLMLSACGDDDVAADASTPDAGGDVDIGVDAVGVDAPDPVDAGSDEEADAAADEDAFVGI